MAKSHRKMVTGVLLLVGALNGTVAAAGGHGGQDGQKSLLDALEDMPALSVSTVPVTGSQVGDQNPYGVTIVPVDSGVLKQGDILVSDFNNVTNLQGTGSSIVRIEPGTGTQSLFFDAGGLVGLSTALVALRSGFVVVGSAPRDFEATPPTVGNGSLIFLDCNGKVVLTLTDSALVNGPWDMTVNDTDPSRPRLFVSNVLLGTVVRIVAHVDKGVISIQSITQIGSGFAFRTDPAALVIGPTGLALDPMTDRLFVADTGANRIAQLGHASTAGVDQGPGSTVFAGPPLEGPLGLLLTPTGHLIAANGDSVTNNTPNLAVEITRQGKLIATKTLDTNGTPGALFGITLTEFQNKPSLVFVNDNDNTVKILATR